MRLEITITGIEPDLVERQQAAGHRVRGRLTDPHRPGALVEGRCVRVGQNRQPPGAAPPRLSDRMRKQRTADAAANMVRFDEQPVQVQRTWRIAGRERDDAGNLPVGPARDPPIAGSDVLSGESVNWLSNQG